MRNDPYDVVVIGYGPVGAAAANLLARAGLSVLAVDRWPGVYPAPRAARLDDGGLRLLQTVGVLDDVAEHVQRSRTDRFAVVLPGGLRLQLRGGPPEPVAPTTAQGHLPEASFVQPEIERALREAARRRGVDALLGHEALRVVETDDGVEVLLRERDGTAVHRVRARYVIGCDGANSSVRGWIGAQVEDLGYAQRILIVDVERSRSTAALPTAPQLHLDPHRPHLFIPIGARHARLEYSVLPGEDTTAVLDPGYLEELVRPWFAPDAPVEVLRRSVFGYRSELVRGWRRGRVLLAGDAAHTMAPWTGNGLLSGWRDVENLSWKLARVLRHGAPVALLDTYETERSPHVRAFIEASAEGGRMLDGQFAAARRAGRPGARPGSTRRSPRPGDLRALAVLAGSLAAQARAGRRGSHPARDAVPAIGPGVGDLPVAPVGTPAPQPVLPDGSRFDDRVGPGFVVVGDAGFLDGTAPATRRAWDALGAAVVGEVPGALARWLDDRGARAVVVRPDRIVAGLARSAAELDGLTARLAAAVLPSAAAVGPGSTDPGRA